MSTYKEKTDYEKEKEEVLNKLKEIDEKYSPEEFVPKEITSLGLEKKEFNAPSDDEILKDAQESLKAEKENDLNKIETNYNSKFSSLNNKVSNLEDEREDDLEEALSSYQSSLKSATNNSIKKGILRSSIYEQAVKAIESDKTNQIRDVEAEFNKEIEKLENERSILERQKENALESFDISYAVKLENKIAKISSEISKQQKEVEKYNEAIEKQEQENRELQEKANLEEQKRIEKHNQQLLDLQEKLGEVEFVKLKQKEKYDVVLDYMLSLPKEKAMEELKKDDSYEMLLGSYYPSLYVKISQRRD